MGSLSGHQKATCFIGTSVVTIAFEKPLTDLFLQQLDLPSDGGLGDADRTSGALYASVVAHREQIAQTAQIDARRIDAGCALARAGCRHRTISRPAARSGVRSI